MKRSRFVAAVVALSAIVAIPFAYSSGLWFGLPVVGGSSYCSAQTGTGTSPTTGIGTGGVTTVCNATVPAGPTSTTGLEMVPADLIVGQTAGSAGPGNAPAQTFPSTAYLPLATVASGAYLLTSPAGLANSTITVPNGITNVVDNLTGAVTTVALIMPFNPYDGQLVRFTANATITSVIVTAGGFAGQSTLTTVDTPTKILGGLVVSGFLATPTQGAVLQGFSYIYNLSNNKWFRLQ